jgi:hypothetical protein
MDKQELSYQLKRKGLFLRRIFERNQHSLKINLEVTNCDRFRRLKHSTVTPPQKPKRKIGFKREEELSEVSS